MTKFILLRGVSGSGKSTHTRKLQDEFNTVVVSRDDLRIALFGIPFTDPKGRTVDEDLVTEVEFAAIRAALSAGHDVASDNTNLYPGPVIDLLNIAKEFTNDIVLQSIDCTLAQCLENNRKRATAGGRFVPEHVITKQSHAFTEYAEDIQELVLWYTHN